MDYHRLRTQLAAPLPAAAAHATMAARFYQSAGGVRQPAQPNRFTRRSAVLIALYPHHEAVFLPLIQRPVYAGVHSAQVALPGGRHEPHDATLVDTALREAHEEVGILPASVTVLGTLTELFVAASNHLVLPVVGTLPARPDFLLQASEVTDLLETTVTALLSPHARRETDLTVGGHLLRAPHFEVAGRVVWGATAMMLSEFVWVWRDAFPRFTSDGQSG